MKVWLFTAMQN